MKRDRWVYYLILIGVDSDLNKVVMYTMGDDNLSCGGYMVKLEAGIPYVFRGRYGDDDCKFVGRVTEGKACIYDFNLQVATKEAGRFARYARIDVFPTTTMLSICKYGRKPNRRDIGNMVKALYAMPAGSIYKKLVGGGRYFYEYADSDSDHILRPL
jgi:hypothetical protein